MSKIALVLLATKHELHHGLVERCIERYIDKPGAKIDVIICMNTHVNNNLDNYQHHEHVNSLTLHNCDIPGDQDRYNRNNKRVAEPLELGQTNGPNQLFFKSMEHLKTTNYQYLMVIECDTKPIKNNWMSKLRAYCDSNDFLIAGSKYKGKAKLLPRGGWVNHLNGVAIYKNCDQLHDVLRGTRELIHFYIHKKAYVMLNYDVALWFYFDQQENINFDTVCIDTDIITNMSLHTDKNISLEQVIEQHPNTIILHKK